MKPVPKTDEEITWFVDYMRSSLEEVKSMNQLAQLWQDNVNSIKSLPEALRSNIIEWKNSAKVRVQKGA